MSRGRQAQAIKLSREDRKSLELLTRRGTAEHRQVVRAQIARCANTYRAQAVWDDFNARHDQRFVFHFTPIHASWVNQIELLFGIYSRRVLRHASHSSIEQLRERTDAFMAQRNRAPKPFKWTFAGFELQTGEPLRFKHHANAPNTRKGR